MESQLSAVLQRTCFRSVAICPVDNEGIPALAWLHPNVVLHAASYLPLLLLLLLKTNNGGPPYDFFNLSLSCR